MPRSLHELSFRAQAGVFVMLAAAGVFGAWQILIGPSRAELSVRRERLTTVRAEAARVSLTAYKLPVLQKEVAGLERSLLDTTAVLPEEKDGQEVLRQLHMLASESSLAIRSFTPKPVAVRTQYVEWPIELGLEGGYHDLGRFFDRVAALSRLISVSNLHIKTGEMTSGGNTRTVVTATCVATTFVFKQASQATAPAAKAGGRP